MLCKSVRTTVFRAASPAGKLLSQVLNTPTSGHSSATLQRLSESRYIPILHSHTCRWLTQLLRTSRLDALMVKHVEMSTEIKSLDSDMQMLVYENYNKFISATDTIRSMKSNVDGMDSNMHELKGLIGQWAAGIVVLSCALSCNMCIQSRLHAQLQGDSEAVELQVSVVLDWGYRLQSKRSERWWQCLISQWFRDLLGQ